MDPRQILQGATQEYKKLGWKKNPFTIQPDPEFLVDFEDEVKELLLSVNNRVHSVVIGDLGTGKTTLLLWLRRVLGRDYYTIYFEEPPSQLIPSLERELRKQKAFGSFFDKIFRVRLTPDKIPRIKKPVVLLIDEAHRLNRRLASELQILADKENLVLVMAGLRETQKRLDANKPLADRFVTKVTLKPMSPVAIGQIIEGRIKKVGGKNSTPMTPQVISEISDRSRGNPREALRLCNLVLNHVMAGGELE